MTLGLADRFRNLPAAARAAFYDGVGRVPGKLADLRHDWAFWARPDQVIDPEDLVESPLVVFAGPKGAGKTRAAVQLWLREIFAGRVERPRIIAATEGDVDKVVVHGISGVMACLDAADRPRWVRTDGGAGALRFRNGVEALCYSANVPEQITGSAGDCDLYDDIAKWGPHAELAWNHARSSCRLGNMTGIAATTRKGTIMLRKLLKGEVSGVLVRRPPDLRINRFNLAARYFRQLEAEIGDSDFWRQELDDEDVASNSPFAGLEFGEPPIRVFEAPRGVFLEVIVAVDPADGKGGENDEWGIGAAGRRDDRHVVALEDGSGSYDDAEAAEAALAICERWAARAIVVEGNRGVARVRSVIEAAYYKRRFEGRGVLPLPEIIPVTAREGKKLRAGPLRTLYLQGLLHHVAGLGALERQQREWDPDGPKRPRQDDRIDWLVHAVHHLAELGDAAERPPNLAEIEGLGERVRKIQGGHNAAPHDLMARSDRVSAEDPRSSFRARGRHPSMSKRGVL